MVSCDVTGVRGGCGGLGVVRCDVTGKDVEAQGW